VINVHSVFWLINQSEFQLFEQLFCAGIFIKFVLTIVLFINLMLRERGDTNHPTYIKETLDKYDKIETLEL